MPPTAGRYSAALAITAGAVLAGAVWSARGDLADVVNLAVVLLAALGALSVVFPLRVYQGGDVQGFNLTSSVLLTLAMLMADAAALLVAASMVAIGFAVTTRSWVKTLFNISQVTVSGLAAIMTARLILGGPVAGEVLAGRTLVALVAAAAVFAGMSAILVSELIHRFGSGSRRSLLGEVVGPGLWAAAGDVVVAVLLTILAERSPLAVVLAVPMFVGLLLGYRGLLSDRETARQAQLLHDTSRQLLDGALDEGALREAVDGLCELFGADHSFLVTGDQTGPGWAEEAVAAVHRTGDPALHTQGTSAIAAPVRLEGRVFGVVVVGGRRGVDDWGSTDLDLLSTVAGEVAATLRTRRLLAQVQQEQARLVAEKGKLTDVLRSASDGIVVLDAAGALAACNPAMMTMLGRGDVQLGRPWSEVLHLHDEDGRPLSPETDHPLGAALSGVGQVERASATLRRPDGDVRWLRCSAAPVVSGGTADGVVLVVVDVTRERELEQLRGDFIATVSHELRTPLTPLAGFLRVLRDHGESLDDDRRTMMVAAMEKQVGRLSDLIGDLLQVAEMERGLIRVNRGVVSLDGALTEVVELEAVAADERGRVELWATSVDVIADPEAVRRILRALISNALKHTSGTVTVHVEQKDGRGVVRVRDEGPMIPADARHLVFEPFRRLGDHLRRTQGPGLGLTVSRALAEALDGSIEVSSTPDGAGNEFVLHLPLTPARTMRVIDLEAQDRT